MSARRVLPDSSVWIELLGVGPLHALCRKEIASAGLLVVPSLIVCEVYRKIRSRVSEDQALSAVAAMSQHEVADLTREIALAAADISIERELGMADSLVLAHAQDRGALLVTLDNDFAGVPGVKILRAG